MIVCLVVIPDSQFTPESHDFVGRLAFPNFEMIPFFGHSLIFAKVSAIGFRFRIQSTCCFVVLL